MKQGADVRETTTGKVGVVVIAGTRSHQVFFPSLKGNLNLDGSTDNGLRDIPAGLLEAYRPEIIQILEAVNNVLQEKKPGVHERHRRAARRN